MNTALSNGGKIGAAITNYKKREAVKQAERRTAQISAPTCWTLHEVMLAPDQIDGRAM